MNLVLMIMNQGNIKPSVLLYTFFVASYNMYTIASFGPDIILCRLYTCFMTSHTQTHK